jgi:hypothetical protein
MLKQWEAPPVAGIQAGGEAGRPDVVDRTVAWKRPLAPILPGDGDMLGDGSRPICEIMWGRTAAMMPGSGVRR